MNEGICIVCFPLMLCVVIFLTFFFGAQDEKKNKDGVQEYIALCLEKSPKDANKEGVVKAAMKDIEEWEFFQKVYNQ